MTRATRFAVNTPHVVHEIFEDGELVILDLKRGRYYSLAGTGAEIWTLAAHGASATEIGEWLANRYAGNCSDMTRVAADLLAELEQEELVRPSEATASVPLPAPEPGPPTRPYVPPVLERFTDMQELLLVDPIHEVEDAGWPRRQDHG